jgi:hypothetical protein
MPLSTTSTITANKIITNKFGWTWLPCIVTIWGTIIESLAWMMDGLASFYSGFYRGYFLFKWKLFISLTEDWVDKIKCVLFCSTIPVGKNGPYTYSFSMLEAREYAPFNIASNPNPNA